MSQSIRQSNLFAAEDWRKIYRAFLTVNFTSYDFDTIKSSLLEYIRLNYPEDFNDYIDSSEFIAIVELLCWLGQSLAFRVDLNVRENFVDTAERRESILRLANLLSYKPRRNKAAQGFLKVVGVRSTADIIDSNGNNINGIRINWNDPNNPDWAEQFTLILNSAFITSNQFGQPVQAGVDSNNVNVQTYQFNNAAITNPGIFSFSSNIDGQSISFENVNGSFTEQTGYTERSPDPYNNWHIFYKNDGQGNQSNNTGFFTLFKQGSILYQDFNITIPIENRILDINVANINEDDVWVQNINGDGSVDIEWTKVPSTTNDNIIYNNIPRRNRNIFSVETRENDQISIRFSDGRFGNVAFGLTRVYYRSSLGRRTTIRPADIQNIAITIPYLTQNNLRKDLTLFLSLQETITNGAPAESNDEIKLNAAQVYYTQNRMVSGEDYNVFPLSDASILKCKAINRTYAGHNRYIDVNDPTGTYQNLNVIADDGILYKESDNNRYEISQTDNLTPEFIISNILNTIYSDIEFKHAISDIFLHNINCGSYSSILAVPPFPYQGLMWDRVTGNNYSSTGRIVNSIAPIPVPTSEIALITGLSTPATDSLDLIKNGSLLRFRNGGWAAVDSIVNNGTGIGNGFSNGQGNIKLSKNIEEGDIIEQILPPVRYTLTSDEIESIKLKLQSNASFGLFYNISTFRWEIINTPTSGFIKEGVYNYCDDARKWMILFENIQSGNTLWAITARGLRYIFESEEDIRFFYVNRFKVVSKETGLSENDKITVLGTNKSSEINNIFIEQFQTNKAYKPNDLVYYGSGLYRSIYICIQNTGPGTFNSSRWRIINPSLGGDIQIELKDNFTYEDGYIEPRKVLVSFPDSNSDGIPDDPTIFDKIIFGNDTNTIKNNNLIFWRRYTSYDGYEYYAPVRNIKVFIGNTIEEAIEAMDNNYENPITKPNWEDGEISLCVGSNNINDGIFYTFSTTNVYTISDTIPIGYMLGDIKIPSDQNIESSDLYKYAVGRNNLNCSWKHFAPYDQRIDPAIGNIIDVYALTSEYDYLVRQYLSSNDPDAISPEPPNSTQLEIQYSSLNEVKMISDQIIWHTTKYKYLFGKKAIEELQARFKIVKLPSSTKSDGEIKADVIELINSYFKIENWDFGDTFYFSELAAFIHQGLALHISSVVLVPVNDESRFGNLYEIKANPDEIFISAATVDDIDIIKVNTETVLRINR